MSQRCGYPGEASGRVRLWFRLHGVRNIEPSISPFWPPLTSTLRFVSPQHFDGEYRCRWEYRPPLTTFDFVVVVVFVFCCCFVLLFFLYHNIEVKHWNDSFNDKGIVWHEYHCLYSSRQGPIRLCMARSHIRIGYNRSSSTYRWLYWPKLLCQNKFRLF